MVDVDALSGRVRTSDGVQLHYLDAGTGRPLLLLHGWSQSADLFTYQLANLSDRFRVIALDQRAIKLIELRKSIEGEMRTHMQV